MPDVATLLASCREHGFQDLWWVSADGVMLDEAMPLQQVQGLFTQGYQELWVLAVDQAEEEPPPWSQLDKPAKPPLAIKSASARKVSNAGATVRKSLPTPDQRDFLLRNRLATPEVIRELDEAAAAAVIKRYERRQLRNRLLSKAFKLGTLALLVAGGYFGWEYYQKEQRKGGYEELLAKLQYWESENTALRELKKESLPLEDYLKTRGGNVAYVVVRSVQNYPAREYSLKTHDGDTEQVLTCQTLALNYVRADLLVERKRGFKGEPVLLFSESAIVNPILKDTVLKPDLYGHFLVIPDYITSSEPKTIAWDNSRELDSTALAINDLQRFVMPSRRPPPEPKPEPEPEPEVAEELEDIFGNL